MKNKLRKVVVPLIVVLLVITLFIFSDKISVDAKKVEGTDFSLKSAYEKQEDGWLYLFRIYYPDDNSDKSYIFNGYNLKYKEMEGYSIPVIDKTTGEIVDEIKPEYVSLINSEEYRDDLIAIRNYFNKKQFNNSITVDDLNGLNIGVVSKEYLVSIFNKAINSSKEKIDGDYAAANFFDIKTKESTDESMKGTWQVAYILRNGDIFDVDIEFIDESGNYILDSENRITTYSNDNNLSNQIKLIEEDMVKNQALYSEKTSDEITNGDLDSLLEEFQSELEQ